MYQPNTNAGYSATSTHRDSGRFRGFYRRGRGVLEHLESGEINLFECAVHDFICLNAQSRTAKSSHLPPGIWIGSARKIWLLTNRQDSERQIQRSLAKLEGLGWIKRFLIKGHRGDYPILLEAFLVADGNGNDFFVSAQQTTDWRNPILVPHPRPVNDTSVTRRRNGDDQSSLLQYAYNSRNKDKTFVPAQVPPSGEGSALAALLKGKILENDPKARITAPQELKWAHDADLLMRVDGRSKDEIQRVILWSQDDSFWRSNVLSMKTLRKKFGQLFLKTEASGTSSGGKNRGDGAVIAPEGKYDACQPELIVS